eukprot:PLAT12492.35.p1 GENE.PLAT12492.35~~PLAT12492.35.p1  ORF type:complete len:817 (-),score=88.42 PLAT12492.35:98-2548(-)
MTTPSTALADLSPALMSTCNKQLGLRARTELVRDWLALRKRCAVFKYLPSLEHDFPKVNGVEQTVRVPNDSGDMLWVLFTDASRVKLVYKLKESGKQIRMSDVSMEYEALPAELLARVSGSAPDVHTVISDGEEHDRGEREDRGDVEAERAVEEECKGREEVTAEEDTTAPEEGVGEGERKGEEKVRGDQRGLSAGEGVGEKERKSDSESEEDDDFEDDEGDDDDDDDLAEMDGEESKSDDASGGEEATGAYTPTPCLTSEAFGRLTTKALALDAKIVKERVIHQRETMEAVTKWLAMHEGLLADVNGYTLCCRYGLPARKAVDSTARAAVIALEQLAQLDFVKGRCFLAVKRATVASDAVFRLARVFPALVKDDENPLRWARQCNLRRVRQRTPTQLSRCLVLYDVLRVIDPDTDQELDVWIEELPICSLADCLPTDRKQRMATTRQLCDAVAQLHRQFVHRDLSLDSIVFTPGGLLKLVLFPASRIVTTHDTFVTSSVVANMLQPPELYTGAEGEEHAADPSGDVYMVAQLLAKLWTGEFAFGQGRAADQMAWARTQGAAMCGSSSYRLDDGTRLEAPRPFAADNVMNLPGSSPSLLVLSETEPHMYALLMWMLDPLPEHRPTSSAVCGHPALQSVETRCKMFDILHDTMKTKRETATYLFNTLGDESSYIVSWCHRWQEHMRVLHEKGVFGSKQLPRLIRLPSVCRSDCKFDSAWSVQKATMVLLYVLRNSIKHSKDLTYPRKPGRGSQSKVAKAEHRAWELLCERYVIPKYGSTSSFFTDNPLWAQVLPTLYRASFFETRLFKFLIDVDGIV